MKGGSLPAMDRDESEDLPRSSQTNEARGQVSVKALNNVFIFNFVCKFAGSELVFWY